MDKEKELKEIAQVICPKKRCKMYNQCDEFFCPEKSLVEKIYNAGYRKTFTSDLARDTQKAYKEGYNKGFADREALEKEHNILYKNYVAVLKHNAFLRNCLREEKKEAVKEFAEKLKAKAWQGYDVGMYIVNTQDIDELLKEYEK